VDAGAVDAVVVYKLDRLTRNIVDAVELVLKEWEGRCALVSVTQAAIDTTNPLGRQFFTLMASFAEFEREMIRDRTLSGKKRRAMQGRNPGFRPPYGYKVGANPGELVVDEEKAAVVVRIFDMYVLGVPMLDVARQLNKEAVPCPGTARGWTGGTIRYMLLNPMYAGRLEYGRTSVNNPRKKQLLGRHKTVHKTPKHAVVPDAVPPLVPVETWTAAQALMKQRSRKTGFPCRAASSQYLLTGLLKCRCGYAMAGVSSRGVNYYRCRFGTGVCDSKAIRADLLDQTVLEAVRTQLRGRMGETLVSTARAKAEASRKATEASVANLKGALAEIQKQREKFRKDYMGGDLNGKVFTQLNGELDKREQEVQGALREAEYALSHRGTVEFDTSWLLTHIDQVMSDTWSELEMGQKKQTLRTLIAGLVAYRGRHGGDVEVELTLATPDPSKAGAVEYGKVVGA
jgi:site-specific DNA recombinase